FLVFCVGHNFHSPCISVYYSGKRRKKTERAGFGTVHSFLRIVFSLHTIKYLYFQQRRKKLAMEITSEEIALHIEKAKKGKQGAFKFLLDYFWNEVFGFQMKRVRNEHEAE